MYQAEDSVPIRSPGPILRTEVSVSLNHLAQINHFVSLQVSAGAVGPLATSRKPDERRRRRRAAEAGGGAQTEDHLAVRRRCRRVEEDATADGAQARAQDGAPCLAARRRHRPVISFRTFVATLMPNNFICVVTLV